MREIVERDLRHGTFFQSSVLSGSKLALCQRGYKTPIHFQEKIDA
jgi:hypothetical protein